MNKTTRLLVIFATISGSALAQTALLGIFDTIDTIADGKLSLAEYVEGRVKREKPLLMKQQNLTDAQYQAKLPAYKGNYNKDFVTKDTNKDGFLTAAELPK